MGCQSPRTVSGMSGCSACGMFRCRPTSLGLGQWQRDFWMGCVQLGGLVAGVRGRVRGVLVMFGTIV